MSTLRITTLATQDGTYSVPSETLSRAACRAWVNFNGTDTVAIRASYNVSSITDNGTGDYTVNFTTAMVDANYATVGLCSQGNRGWAQQRSAANATGSTNIRTIQEGSGETDSAAVYVAIFR